MRPLRIAMIGTRGVPASYGGIEHHVEEVGARLAARGHDVTVYCRPNYVLDRAAEHRGMTLRHLPTVDSKHLDAIAHSAVSSADAMLRSYDVVHFHALGPGLVAPLPRYASRAKVVLTVHGLDNQRAKWGGVAKAVLGTAAWMSARVPDATVVVSRELQAYYTGRYRRATEYIPNGVEPGAVRPARRITAEHGLAEGGYLLFLGRLVPEKAPDLLVRAFAGLPGERRLVIAGGSSYTSEFVTRLKDQAAADPRVLFLGYVYGDLLDELYSNAAAFVLPSDLEGLPLTLLEAASYGTPVVASDIPPHLEVVGGDAPGHRLFAAGDVEGLRAALTPALTDPAAERAAAADLRERVLRDYRWDVAVDALEGLYGRLVGDRRVRVRNWRR